MKAILRLFFGIAAILKSALAESSTPETTCTRMNKFLDRNELRSMVHRSNRVEPESDTSICGGLWAKSGSCCRYSRARDLAKDDTIKLTNIAEDFIKILTELRTKTQKYVEDQHAQVVNGRKTYFKEEVSFLDGAIGQSSEFKKYKESLRECIDHTKVARRSAFCFICAGNSTKYLLSEGAKAAITQGSCSNMLDKCDTFFKKTMRLITGARRLGVFISKMIVQDKKIRWVKGLEFQLNKSTIMNDLLALKKDGISPTLKRKIEASLCSKLYRLVKTPMIIEIYPVIKYLKFIIDDILQDLVTAINLKAKRTLLLRHSDSLQLDGRPGARSLQTAADLEMSELETFSTETLFEGDTSVLINNDGMWHSFEGSQGSGTSVQNCDIRPMNLTTKFP